MNNDDTSEYHVSFLGALAKLRFFHTIMSTLASWCLTNADTLSLKSFVDKFGHTNKEEANRQYWNILNSKALSHLKNIKELKSDFSLWKDSRNEARFWQSLTTEDVREDTYASLKKNMLQILKKMGEEEQEKTCNRR